MSHRELKIPASEVRVLDEVDRGGDLATGCVSQIIRDPDGKHITFIFGTILSAGWGASLKCGIDHVLTVRRFSFGKEDVNSRAQGGGR